MGGKGGEGKKFLTTKRGGKGGPFMNLFVSSCYIERGDGKEGAAS